MEETLRANSTHQFGAHVYIAAAHVPIAHIQ